MGWRTLTAQRLSGSHLVHLLWDNVAMGVVEPMVSKVKMVQFATEAAVTILRIDDDIRIADAAE